MSSEFLRFAGLLVIVGIAWCGYVFYHYKNMPQNHVLKTIEINKTHHKKLHQSKTLQSI